MIFPLNSQGETKIKINKKPFLIGKEMLNLLDNLNSAYLLCKITWEALPNKM